MKTWGTLLRGALVLAKGRMVALENPQGASFCPVTCLEGPDGAVFYSQVVELKLGGKDIPVTSANRIAYIHLVADYRLNKQIRPHCLAFRQGLANVVSLEWLRMFDQQEIQVP